MNYYAHILEFESLEKISKYVKKELTQESRAYFEEHYPNNTMTLIVGEDKLHTTGISAFGNDVIGYTLVKINAKVSDGIISKIAPGYSLMLSIEGKKYMIANNGRDWCLTNMPKRLLASPIH